jgi:hypothetical protein
MQNVLSVIDGEGSCVRECLHMSPASIPRGCTVRIIVLTAREVDRVLPFTIENSSCDVSANQSSISTTCISYKLMSSCKHT